VSGSSTAGEITLIVAESLAAIPLIVVLLPSNRRRIAQWRREIRRASERKKERERRP
jgi:hypothetical protein